MMTTITRYGVEQVELVGGALVPRQEWDERWEAGKKASQDPLDKLEAEGMEMPPPGYYYTPGGTLVESTLDQGDGQRDGLMVRGDQFILEAGADPEPLWGKKDQVLLAEGEALVIAGVQGAGKTTLAQQLCLGWIGLPKYESLLDFPVQVGKRVLYLAMDRPRQAARSFRRMIDESDGPLLRDHLVVWQGPPPEDLAQNTEMLLDLCQRADADLVVIDSLKDAAIGLSDDAVGAGWNRARQLVCAAGIQILELHHLRKQPNTNTRGEIGIDDLYGSTWITSGAGSVILLQGNPGDAVVSLRHLKQPISEVGPYKILHDADRGHSEIYHSIDLVAFVRASGSVTVLDAAKALYDTYKPTQSDKVKARRRLDGWHGYGRTHSEGGRGVSGTGCKFGGTHTVRGK